MTPTDLLATPAADAQIVSAVRSGDADRYRELVQRHERLVFAVAWSRLGDAALAEEAAQEAFIRGYRRLWLLRDGAKFPGWIAAIARRAAINLGLRRRRELERCQRWALEHTDPAQSPADEAAAPASPEMLRQALEELPPAHRECLVLYYLEGRSGSEAAAALGISETALRTRLHRARTAMRERLEKKLGESLEQLRPARPLAPAVMGAILATPSAKVAGGGIGAKILYSLLPLKFFPVLFGAIAILPGLAVAAVTWRLDERNYRDADGFRARKYRLRSRRGLWLAVPLLLAPWILVYLVVRTGLSGIQGLFLGIGLISVPPLLFSVRKLMICRSRMLTTTVVSLFVSIPGWLAIGLGWLPVSANGVLMVVYLILFAVGFGARPLRLDYCLFRRALKDLPDGVPGGQSPNDPGIALDKAQLLAFARFMGTRLVVADFAWQERGLRLRLPALKTLSLAEGLGCSGLFPFSWHRLSTLRLARDGTVSAHLGIKDEAVLLAEAGSDLASTPELEKKVASAVESAWRHFRAGEPGLAERALGHAPDSEIFKVPPGRARSTRLMQFFMISMATLIVVLLAPRLLWPALFSGLKPVDLTETQVRSFLAGIQSNNMIGPQPANSAWSALSRPDSFLVLPPTNLFTADALSTLKGSLRPLVGGSESVTAGQRTDNPLRVFGNPWLASRAIEGGWISWDDLGTTPEEVSAFAHRPATLLPPALRAEDLLINEESRPAESDRRFTVQRLSENAPDLLRLLRDVQCLDLMPRDQLVQKIASVQVLSGKVPAGEPPVRNWRRVRGLFFTPGWPVLRDTYLSVASLEVLGGLDKLDREACIHGILRLHHGKGLFASSVLDDHNELQVKGDARDTFFAFESLRILGGLDRVKDLEQWKFRPDHQGDKTLPNWNDIEAWVCEQRLAKILADHKANPHAPYRSLRNP